MAYKEAKPQALVFISVPGPARIMLINNSRCYQWEDRKQ